jgi:hypothetical protein
MHSYGVNKCTYACIIYIYTCTKAVVREYVRKFRERRAAKNSKALRPLDITNLTSRAGIDTT